MSYLYLVIDLIVFALPLSLSFDRRVAYFRRWPSVGVSILVVGTVYVVWDVLVTRSGHWWFNPQYSGLVTILGLPLAELLFFVVVPFACLFIYEVVRAYFPEHRSRRIRLARAIGLGLAAVSVILALVFRGQGYTMLALLSVAALLVTTVLLDPVILLSSHTLLFLALCYLPFLVANGVLAALPIVGYNGEEIWGIRAVTIPVEDFFYNLSLLGFSLVVYRLAERRRAA